MDLFGEEDKKIPQSPITGYSLKVIAPKKKSKVGKHILIAILVLGILSGVSFAGYKVYKNVKVKADNKKALMERRKKEREEKLNDAVLNIEKLKEKPEKPKIQKINNFAEKQNQILASNNSEAYILFVGGPKGKTKEILNILDEENIKANYFFLGKNIKENEKIIKDIYDKGHYISVTGYTEEYLDIYESGNKAADSVVNSAKSLKDIFSGEIDSYLAVTPGPLLVSSFNSLKSEAENILKENGIDSVKYNQYINIDEESSEMNYLLDEKINSKSNLVLLVYESENEQAKILKDIIKKLKDTNYKFKTYYDLSDETKSEEEKEELENMFKENETKNEEEKQNVNEVQVEGSQNQEQLQNQPQEEVKAQRENGFNQITNLN